MSESNYPYDAAVLIGRFQPLHAGHLTLLDEALRLAPRVLVVLGSAHQARSARNPFTWRERAALLREVASENADRITPLPVRDYYDEHRWREDIEAQVQAALQGTLASRIVLVGHHKDATSEYLHGFAGWHYSAVQRSVAADATRIREAFFCVDPDQPPVGSGLSAQIAGVLQPVRSVLPAATRSFLISFAGTSAYRGLCRESQMLRAYRASWQAAPYPPVFVTVDALVTAQQHVLLVRRGQEPGAGLLALPGGFLEPRDSLRQSALRELAEETGLTVDAAMQPVRAEVFDHPDRSARGRVISHVFHWPLPGERPAAVGGDDAAEALWVPIAELPSLEAQFFDDHFHVLDVFLGLLSGVQPRR